MTFRATSVLIPLLLLMALLRPLCAHNGDQTAYAIPLSGITIDGRLDDWPDEMAIYPIEWIHPTAYQPSPPRGPHDRFRPCRGP